MSSTTARRPDTPLGNALADRVLAYLETGNSANPDGLIDLTTAEPALTPSHIGQTAKSALDQGETHYTDGSGIPQLRDAIASHLDGLGFGVEPESIGVSNGGTEAIYIALQVALNAGDRVAVIEPMSRHIVDMVSFIGAEPVRIRTSAANGFVPDPDSIAKSDARVLLVASPSPITGTRIPDRQLEALVKEARDNDMAVILDLSYAAGLYEPEPVQFSDPSLAEEIILAGSFSTAHGLAGWRVGFFSAPPGDRALLQGLKTAMSICTTAVSQFAAVAALGEPAEWFAQRRAQFAANRDLVTARLDRAGIGFIVPDIFPPLLIDVSGAGNSDEISRQLAKAGVIVDSGFNFGDSTHNYIRINLGAAEADLAKGLEMIVDTIASQPAGGS